MEKFSEHKHALESELNTIVEELSSIAQYNQATDDWVAVPEANTLGNADPNDVADTTEEWNTRRAMMGQLEVRYKNVKRALQKITDGTYGICEISGEQIEAERLTANPAARTCTAHMNDEAELPV
jgi:RNA polymerase-binding transcription factor DksA